MKKITTSEFIESAKSIHESKYDYSKVEYVNANIKVCIICTKHGEFWQTPGNHIHQKQGCSSCAGKRKLTNDQFIERSKSVHGDSYDYSNVKYINNRTKVCIICPEHGEFWQTPINHLKGDRCNKCFMIKRCHNTTKFIQKANNIHGYKYDYSKVEYINSKTKICIICPDHGEFWQIPNSHLNNSGCPICRSSKGESKIRKLLQYNSVIFIEQYKFNECRNRFALPFDFYLPELNTCIEYDGKQHYESMEFFGGKDGFKSRKKHDKIKTNYCLDNNIKLIRIRYDEIIKNKIINLTI